MTLKNITVTSAEAKLEKHVARLQEPAKRAKHSLLDALEKSVKRIQDQAEKSVSDKEKSLFERKAEKLSNDLKVLKVLSEEDIVRYALLMLNKLMPIASNPRIPREERMKARVATHKPLSTHLTRLERKLSKVQEGTESESEIEQDKNCSSLNKITFNNTVVLMRKDVRRAKVHIIHKLTRAIKKLRMAKGKEEKVAKSQRKAERMHKKVIHIKELHEDEISKFALSTTQNLGHLATDIKAPTTSQALAAVAVHQFVAAHVKEFKTKYPNWKEVVPNFLKKKKKKRKLNLETNATGETSNKLGNDNSQSESENNSQSESENSLQESETEEESGFSENETEKRSEVEGDETSQDKNFSDSDDDVSNVSNSCVESVKNRSDNSSKKKKAPAEDFDMIQKNSEESTKITLNKKTSKTKEKTKNPSIGSPNKPIAKVIDPFFVTATNEEYVTSQIPPSGESDLPAGKNQHFEPNKSKRFDDFGDKNKWKRTSSEGKYGKFNRLQDSAPYKKQSFGSFDKCSSGPKMDKLVFGNRKERRKALHQPQVQEKVEKLHPSWEAKKKQSSIIPFQGKKVTFD